MVHDRRTRLLFLAFGYSIHAQRRVKVFSTDHRFKVHLASDYQYAIDNVGVTVLDGKAGMVRSRKHLERYVKALASFMSATKIHCASEQLFQDMLVQLFAFRQLLQTVRRFKPDAVFLQTMLYPAYLGCFLPANIPKIITFWNGDLIWWSQTSEILRTFKRQIVESGIRNAAAATVNSETAKTAALGYGISPQKLHVIRYPGVDLGHFAPNDSLAARKRLSLSQEHIVLCPRGLGGYLNSDVLIEAACVVCKMLPDALFLFVSKVGLHLWEDLLSLPRRLGLADHFRHDGQIAWEDMPDYYRSADIMVSPSSNDSQPNCMLEAMACGTAVIMGDIPSIREWVVHKRNGLLIPPRDPSALANAIVSLLRDEPKRKKFSRINLALVRDRVDSRVACEQVKDVVQCVLQGNDSLSGGILK
ncbi:glycosyltransferase family 4 protein [Desulfonatronum parangueonense]